MLGNLRKIQCFLKVQTFISTKEPQPLTCYDKINKNGSKTGY